MRQSDVPRVVVVGAAARDIVAEDPRGWRLGGGVSYSALTTAQLGLATGALIGVDEPAQHAAELDLLRQAGVDVRVVPLAQGPVFENREGATGRIQILHQSADPLSVDVVPADWRDAASWMLVTVADELPDAWAEVPKADALVAAGWQGLLRVLVPGERVRHRPPGPSAILSRADIVGVSRDDVGPDAEVAELCRYLRPGSTLALTQGNRGGLMLTAEAGGPSAMRHYPAVQSERIVDPTGAGDVFLAALLAARTEPRLVGGHLDRHYDLKLAAAVASLVLEKPGLLGVPDRAAVRARMAGAR